METMDQFIPGMRVQIRDAEWRIDRVDVPTHGGMLLTCTGHSELVRGRTAKFLTDIENDVKVLTPETTHLVDDLSDGYMATQLYIDTVLRTTPPSDNKIHIGHLAAMDLLPFQLDPALQALDQTRPRILIADSVGLGKTIAAGILVSELMRRQRGKRILVLVIKSMLMQFQREFWQRFTIPLVRLDSVGLQRVRNNIPTNHNPFHYFDRSIISIDTLKQNLEYRDYIENSHWDIVVIDEAQNVARRSSNSLRHQLAQTLSTRCDAMIMLSATPHDGRAESFASLMNMLDPTAIPNPKDYERDDYKDKGLVVRRFKSDVADQLSETLPERVVHKRKIVVSQNEEYAFELVRNATFKTLNKGSSGGGHLFKTTLEKALLSSPAACHSTVNNRLIRLKKKETSSEDVIHDTAQLEAIGSAVGAIDAAEFAKYQLIVRMLEKSGETSIGWDKKKPTDRIVVFTESVKTLEFLVSHMPKDLKLKKNEVTSLDGQMRDVDLVNIVNDFNNPTTPLRLLLCSNVASEGLNLHHCSHRLMHFDIPWSLMVFQQRNGRIDRIGQSIQPEIYYLISECSDPRTRGDHRVLEILIEKDEQASKNLGDPSEFMGGASIVEQEEITAKALESGDGADNFSGLLDSFMSKSQSGMSGFDAEKPPTRHEDLPKVLGERPRVFAKAADYAKAALSWISLQRRSLDWSYENDVLDLKAPADLQYLAKRLPREAIPEDFRFFLTDDKKRIQDDMAKARDDETGTFGKLQYLWPQHPVFGWLMQTVGDAFGRHAAPVMRLPQALQTNEHWVLAQGGFPNKRGQALIQSHLAVRFVDDEVIELLSFAEVLDRLNLVGESIPNQAEPKNCDNLTLYLPDAVEHLKEHLKQERLAENERLAGRLASERHNLEALRNKHIEQLELALTESSFSEGRKQSERKRRMNHIAHVFDEFENWLSNTWETEEDPYIQIVAVITGDPGETAS